MIHTARRRKYRDVRHIRAARVIQNGERQPFLELKQEREIVRNHLPKRILRHKHDDVAEQNDEQLKLQIQFIVQIDPLHVHHERVRVRLRVVNRLAP